MTYAPLILISAIMMVCAATGAIFKPGDWYRSLNKPSWTPPNWMFPVVWTVLYIMIAYAGWLVWQTSGASTPMLFWTLQAVFNGLWSYFFFSRKRMDLALADVAMLWVAIVGFIVTAFPISQTAALLFVPYLIWVTIASALNATMIAVNREEVRRRRQTA